MSPILKKETSTLENLFLVREGDRPNHNNRLYYINTVTVTHIT